MTLSPRAVEAAARAIAETRGAIWTRPDHTVSATFDYDAAKAALTAALAVDGLCLVPKEPTSRMLCAAVPFPHLLVKEKNDPQYTKHMEAACLVERDASRQVWLTMLAAASTGDSPREDNKK